MIGGSLDAPTLEAPPAQVISRALVYPLIVPLFCLALFIGSGLLFLAELMFAKMVLPLLGGTPAVWNTCMVGFQALLLAGYAYGHWSIGWLGMRRQSALQLFLLIAVAISLPIAIPSGWQPPVGHTPIFWLLAVLGVAVGLPFFVVAGTAPVLQRWFSATGHRAGKDPYFLYAASNLGSMIALLAYPILVEPTMHLADQSRLWAGGYLALIALVGLCALVIKPQPVHSEIVLAGPTEGISIRRRFRWILLAMVPSSLLLGSTTFITTDIAAVPLLWIVPLAIYLLSFILVFLSRPLVPHRIMRRMQPVVVLWVALFMLGRVGQPVWMVLALHLMALFVSSMVCHGELAADRPSIGRLTDFYLTLSFGGVLGGLFNALLAPLLFHTAAEYPLALIAACALCPHATKTARGTINWMTRILDVAVPLAVGLLAAEFPRILVVVIGVDSMAVRMIGFGAAVMLAATAIRRRPRFITALAVLFFVVAACPAKGQVLAIRRSFFGIHRVVRNPDGPFNDLYHGTTVHGRQFVDAVTGLPTRPTDALTYYYRTGPIGQLLLQRTSAGRAGRITVVGMGVGSLAAYAGPGTQLTYYEIDPAVRWIAQDSGYFSFLQSAENRGATVRIVMGDARLTLQDAPSRSCDVLVLDAFCGDAIPVHLLTRQAMKIYTDKLAEGGVLAIHVSNMYLDLLPVCSALAADANCAGLYQDDLILTPREAAEGKSASQWILIARSPRALAAQARDSRWTPLPPTSASRVWTDDFSNILSVFRWR
jgi:hypothetical protein